jgi:hypothetical protein
MNDGLGEGLLVFEVEPELPHPVRRSASEEEDNTRIKTRPAPRALLAKTRITVKVPWSPPIRDNGGQGLQRHE